MKTLVYCTSFAQAPVVWNSRYAIWVESVRRSGIHFDQLLIVDDCSPCLPQWTDVEIVRERDAPGAADVRSSSPILIYHHEQRLGRIDLLDFPGWHRSFAFGALYAEAHGFERVVHLESDAHIISQRLGRHFNHVEAGWLAMWSRKYWFPEMAIQVAAGPQVAEMAAFARQPYTEMVGRVHEYYLPYTHAERLYRGDRFGESIDHIPRDADFATQVLAGEAVDYTWWLANPPAQSSRSRGSGQTFHIGHPDLWDPRLFDGDWSWPEADHRWMIEYDSRLRLPPATGAQVVSLDVRPFLETSSSSQWLLVLMNEQLVGEFHVLRRTRLFCDVPASALRSEGPNLLRLVHPNAIPVNAVSRDSVDTRRLSLALEGLEMRPL